VRLVFLPAIATSYHPLTIHTAPATTTTTVSREQSVNHIPIAMFIRLIMSTGMALPPASARSVWASNE
jgi:hypothetical protein